MKLARGVLFLLVAATVLPAQTALSNASLTGRYFFRYIQLRTVAGGAINHIESLAGVFTFDGAGKYTFTAAHTSDGAAPDTVNGSGTYTVGVNGTVSMTGGLTLSGSLTGLTLNARLAGSLLIGSSTEALVTSGGATVDLLLALPAPSTALVSDATFSGTYQFATLDFLPGSPLIARSTMFTAVADGKRGMGNFTVSGHASNLASGAAFQTQQFAGSYAVNGDGTGGFNLSPVTGALPPLLSGPRNLYITQDGNYVMGATAQGGGHDILFGVRAAATSSNSSFSGLYFAAGLALGSNGLSAYAGSANSGGAGSMLFYRRLHYASPSAAGSLDFTGAATYALGADGTGTSQLLHMAAGANGQAAFFVAEGDQDPNNYELDVAALVPSAAVLGKVFLSPLGVVNAASLAPVGNPVAPGEYVSLFGIGLAAAPAGAVSLPLPKSLGGVSVAVNGNAAPLNYVSPNQINALIPFGATGSKATFVVTNGSASNSVDVPLAATAPGIFSQTSSGSGAAVVLKPDYSLVTVSNPVHRGDTILIYLTGLGAVSPAIPDGAAAPASPLSKVVAPVSILVGGQLAATPSYAGLAPGFAGLYQINVTIPLSTNLDDHVPLVISTNEAFHDQVNIPVH